ncbi:ribokinase [Schizosaccharomyces japonicus yFS275]|uniref:Ribokinase n=1 Tax=Schizosaccharomyces japonicus (strain yFS275 / FY16936) TaxID=402676 RepID=B6K3I9_SCHJY|nr:ribokinase [Schizosaccharomyces japonicus yFS275]EEB08046.1 ribokinase [Schizosaccharomyces japonicus yFS275]
MNRILVIGSLNADLVMRTKACPKAGETVHSLDNGFSQGLGGKGANQAVAAARMTPDDNTKVMMAGCVGEDAFGRTLLEGLHTDKIDTSHVQSVKGISTGVAMIIVEQTGENRILLSAGANGLVDETYVDKLESVIAESDMIILQLEIPIASVAKALEIANKHNTPVLLNPAPAFFLSDDMLSKCDYLVPNEHEAAIVLNETNVDITVDNAEKYALRLLEKGVRKAVIITLGSHGSYFVSRSGAKGFLPAAKVKAVDTTGAGDTFIGAFANQIVSGIDLKAALEFATKCSAITVQRAGAQSSIPTYSEVVSMN